MAVFTPKQVQINGKPVPFVQNSLKITSGYGETTVRSAVSGRSTVQVLSENLEMAYSKISLDLYTTDASDDTDPRRLIKIWKQNANANTLAVIPDGTGQNQYFAQIALCNDPEINESPDGAISLEFKGKAVQLT